jgi:hypothetical protein
MDAAAVMTTVGMWAVRGAARGRRAARREARRVWCECGAVGLQVAVVVGMVWKEADVKQAEAQERCRRQDDGEHGAGEVGSGWVRSGANLDQWIWPRQIFTTPRRRGRPSLRQRTRAGERRAARDGVEDLRPCHGWRNIRNVGIRVQREKRGRPTVGSLTRPSSTVRGRRRAVGHGWRHAPTSATTQARIRPF